MVEAKLRSGRHSSKKPGYTASSRKGKVRRGKDGRSYKSVKTKDGRYVWKLASRTGAAPARRHKLYRTPGTLYAIHKGAVYRPQAYKTRLGRRRAATRSGVKYQKAAWGSRNVPRLSAPKRGSPKKMSSKKGKVYYHMSPGGGVYVTSRKMSTKLKASKKKGVRRAYAKRYAA